MRGRVKRMKAADRRVSAAPKTSNTPPLLLPPSADNNVGESVKPRLDVMQ